MQIFIFLAKGFEEIEAISVIDILRRGGLHVSIISVDNQKMVLGSHNISIVSDNLFEETDFSNGDAFILPGGMPGSNNLNNHTELKNLLKKVHLKNKIIAAICAAPLVLGNIGLLHKKKATIYPGLENQLIGANCVPDGIVKDGNIITGKAPSFVFDFALLIVSELNGGKKSEEIAKAMLYNQRIS